MKRQEKIELLKKVMAGEIQLRETPPLGKLPNDLTCEELSKILTPDLWDTPELHTMSTGQLEHKLKEIKEIRKRVGPKIDFRLI